MNKKFITLYFVSGYVFFAASFASITTVWAQQPTSEPDANVIQKTNNYLETQLVLPEGFIVVDRKIRLVRHPQENRWFVSFVALPQTKSTLKQPSGQTSAYDDIPQALPAEPFSRPLEILPGQWLEKMIQFSGDKMDLDVKFRLWGETTTYHNRNFILPSYARAVSLFGADADDPKDQRGEKVTIESILEQFDKPETLTSSTQKTPVEEDKTQLPQQLRQALLSLPRTKPLLSAEINPQTAQATSSSNSRTTASEFSGQAASSVTAQQVAWRDGFMIIDRVGRLVYDHDEDQWTFAFEADAASLAEPPIVLHPSQLLEVMEKVVARTNRNVRFRISGQITRYQGRAYMLLRKVLMVHDMGNLTK